MEWRGRPGFQRPCLLRSCVQLGGIICLGLKWLSYKTPAVSWASQEWQGKEGCSEYWGELHCGGCGAKFALASGIWNQVTAVLPSAPAAGGSCPKPSASPLQCVSEVHHHAAQNLMCVFQCTNTNEHVGGAHFPDRSFQFLGIYRWPTHTHTVTIYKRSETQVKREKKLLVAEDYLSWRKNHYWCYLQRFLNICKIFLTILLYGPTIALSNNRNDSTVPSDGVPTISFVLSHHHCIVYMQIFNTA